jgi:hypothetical protein
LDSFKSPPDALCQTLGDQSFTGTGYILQQNMAVCQKRHHKQFDAFIFTNNHASDIVDNFLAQVKAQNKISPKLKGKKTGVLEYGNGGVVEKN